MQILPTAAVSTFVLDFRDAVDTGFACVLTF